MSKTCSKCGFVNTMDSEFLSETECPKCGVVYKKEQRKLTTGGISKEREFFRKSSPKKQPVLSVVFLILAVLSFLLALWVWATHEKGDYNIIVGSALISEGLLLLAIAQVLEYLYKIMLNTEK